jgi:hypothetical protein
MTCAIAFPTSIRAQEECPEFTIELNFVFLHGAPGEPLSMTPLRDTLASKLKSKIAVYEQNNPGMNIQVNTWIPNLDNDESVSSWADNIANFVNDSLPDKENLILIGHSMGGKSAIYAVYNNSGLKAKTLSVITINSPIEKMSNYKPITGYNIWENFCDAWLNGQTHDTGTGDNGVCASVAHHDSRDEARWIAQEKHLLMFISGELHPNSGQCDLPPEFPIFDGLPRDQDDNLFPMSAQCVPEADVVYYGPYCHCALQDQDPAARNFMAETIASYVFGDLIGCSVLVREGNYDHKSAWGVETATWEDIRGDVLTCEGSWHRLCRSAPACFWNHQIVGCNPCPVGDERSRYEVYKSYPSDLWAFVDTYDWESSSDVNDCRIYFDARAESDNRLTVNWAVYRKGLLPCETPRDHYEVRVIDCNSHTTGISWARWETVNANDCRIRISSYAWEGTFWLSIGWQVYKKESRQVCLISDIVSGATLPAVVYDGPGGGGPLVAKHYLVTGTVSIPSSSTLTIHPGAKIYFQSDSKIVANGTLEANAESGNPICMVSLDIPCRGLQLTAQLRMQNGGEFKPGSETKKKQKEGEVKFILDQGSK